MSSYCMDQMALRRVENLSISLKNVANLIVDKSGILKLDTWTLYELGEAFCMILDVEQHTNFHVLPIRDQQDDLTANLQFAYDLLQRIKKFHIFTNPSQPLPSEQVIHLRCLRNLYGLELDKVSIYQLKGLQAMRPTLQSLVIRGANVKLYQILTCCGADKATEYPWEKLQIGIFSHNKLPRLDGSLKLLPSVKVLDFSHCGLVDASALNQLQTLKHLNLSHNKLTEVPVFKDNVTYSLLTLNLSNNLIFDLKGLEDLINIEELNVSNNLLGLNESLISLKQLSQLRCLNLVGNPITYNLNYRIHTLRLLNSATFFCEDLVLDDEPVIREERKEISAISEMFLPPSTGVLDVMSSSMQSIVSNGEVAETETKRKKPVWEVGPEEVDVTPVSSLRELPRRRRNHTRFADIKDQDCEENNVLPPTETSFGSFAYLLKHSSTDNALSLLNNEVLPRDIMHVIEDSHSDKLLEEILQSSPSGLFMTDEQEAGQIIHRVPEDALGLDDSMIESTDSSCLKTVEPLSHQSSDISPVPSEVEEEEKDVIYLLAKKHFQNKTSEEDIILVTSQSFFREKNALTNKTLSVWPVGCLESLEILLLEPPKVKINFRSYSPLNKHSIYTLAKEDFQTLKSILDPIMERNTMREIYKSTMNCVKCEAEFPKSENTREDGKVFCPICGSGVVIMSTFEDSLRTEQIRIATNSVLPHASDIYARPAGYREATPMFSETGSSEAVSICSESSSTAKKHDWNSTEASMSSIEVVSENQKREDGKYEQMVEAGCKVDARTPNSASDNAELLSVAKMQDSSSSGSMTGSICTAVDQSSNLNTPVHLRPSVVDNTEATPKVNPGWIIGQQNFSDGFLCTSANSVETVYHNALQSLTHSEVDGHLSNNEVYANKFSSWINSILHSLTGYAWNWWDEIISKEDGLPVVLVNPFSYNYEDPSSVDHRIKVYAEFILFKEQDEHLLGSFKATIMTGCDSYYCGFLFISNLKFYILEITGPEDADMQSWLKVKHTHPYEEVAVICSLLHNQGLAIRISDLNVMVFFGDSQRTNNAFNFIYDCLDSDEQQISVEEWSPRQEDRLRAQFSDIFLEDDTDDKDVSLFILVTLLQDEGKCSNEFLVLSCSQILLFKADLKWYFPHDDSKNAPLQFTMKEDLMNLSAIEVYGNTLVSLTFDRGDGTSVNKWDIHVVSESSMCQLIQAMKIPWSQLFGVDLEVTDYSVSAGVLSKLNADELS